MIGRDMVALYNDLRAKAANSPLSELLPLLLILANDLGDSELDRWAQLELGGYLSDNPALRESDIVPEYRAVSGQWLDDHGQVFLLDDRELAPMVNSYRLRHGVAELEQVARSQSPQFIRDLTFPSLIREHLQVQVTQFRFLPREVSGVLSSIRMNVIQRLSAVRERVYKIAGRAIPETDTSAAVENLVPTRWSENTMQRIGAMIGSPSDAGEERLAITDALLRWNAVNRDKGIVIEPVRWETHATPGLQGRPQGMINAELMPISDILLAVFRLRAGSPTGKELSGTIEEIREFMRAGKYVVLYFYEGTVDIRSVDPDQLKTITEFRKEIQQHGLTAGYSSVGELREHILCHMTSIVGRLPTPEPVNATERNTTTTNKSQLDGMSASEDGLHLEQARQCRRVDEKVAEVLDETYRRLFRLYESVSSYVKIIEWSHEASKERKLEAVGKANQEFWDCFLLNRIYVPPRLYEEIRRMAGKLTDIANGFTDVRRREERGLVRDDEEDGWMTAFNSMNEQAGPLFKSVVRQIQERIGVHDTEEPDATSR